MNADDFSLDELASAYLDNEVTPDERARAESDPGVMARVAVFRSLDAQVSADFTADLPAVAATQDDMISRALGLFDAGLDAPTASISPSAPVIPLATRRSKRMIPWNTLAVAAVVLGGIVIVGRSISLSGSSESSESANVVAAAATTAAATAAPAAAAEGAVADAVLEASEPAATEAAAPAITEAASAQPATVATIGSINDGATAGESQSTDAAPAAESAAELVDTTVVSLTAEDQLQVYVASLIGRQADRKTAPVFTSCLISGVAVENVSWQGVAGVLVLSPDATAPTTAEIIDATCGVMVRVAITR